MDIVYAIATDGRKVPRLGAKNEATCMYVVQPLRTRNLHEITEPFVTFWFASYGCPPR